MNDIGQKGYLDIIPPFLSKETQIHYYQDLERNIKFKRNIENQFICMKGFSSSTPLFHSVAFDEFSFGGGLYFRWNGKGVVVDPGIGFLSLMHKHNIFLADVDIVIVTHSHLDHNQDVRSIASLQYDLVNQRKRTNKFFSSFFTVESRDSAYHIEWYLDETTAEMMKGQIENVHPLGDMCDGKTHDISSALDIGMRVFTTKHCDFSYGIKLFFKQKNREFVWGYTSDTGYFDGLSDNLEGCDALVLNISEVDSAEYNREQFKENHLGFNGCVSLLEKNHPKLTVISEFACMRGDNRHLIVKNIVRYSDEQMKLRILPAEIGLTIDISGEMMKCSICGEVVSIKEIYSIRSEKDYWKIRYVCKDCIIQAGNFR